MILWRPVYQRASLIAFSFASAPPFVKKDITRSPGVTSARSRASSERPRDVLLHERRRRGEVEVAVAVEVPEVAALRGRDGDRVDRRADRPRVQDVPSVVGLDPIGVGDGHYC